MPAPKRMTRVNELMKREIANLMEFERSSFHDLIVSVTKVDTTPNLKRAQIYISVLNGSEEQNKSIMTYLKKNRVAFQKKIAKVVTLKNTPVLEFIYDKNIEEGDRVMAILEGL